MVLHNSIQKQGCSVGDKTMKRSKGMITKELGYLYSPGDREQAQTRRSTKGSV
jgi:hypothetical protein